MIFINIKTFLILNKILFIIIMENLLEKLGEKENKYPNIVTLWKTILNYKKESLELTIKQCQNMLNNIENMNNDLTKEQIILLYLMKIN